MRRESVQTKPNTGKCSVTLKAISEAGQAEAGYRKYQFMPFEQHTKLSRIFLVGR